MKDITFDVKPNEMVAVVGPTGGGKTTLINLLMRFYDINKGKITIDGNDIKNMSRYELRHMIGMVLQDTWLFEGTIAENIAYGKPDATMEEIIKASKAMYSIMRGKTSFVIAHRLSTIKNANLILVVKDGDIIETGTHQSLLDQNGFYSSLYNSQFEQAV